MAAMKEFPGFRAALSSVAVPPGAFGLAPPPAEAPTNRHAGLYRLPNELVIQVLASCPDFSTLWSLARTSRTLWALFGGNAAAVVEGVLQQGVSLPLAGILRATARAHLGTLCGGDQEPAVNHLVWAQSPPFRRDEVPTGLLRNIVRLAHDIHVLSHLYLEERLLRCAAMPMEPPRWALAPPSPNEVFRVEMCLWRAQLTSPFSWDWSLPAEEPSIASTLQRSEDFAGQLRYRAAPQQHQSLEQLWEDMGWGTPRSLPVSGAADGMWLTPSLGPMSFPIKMPDPEPMARKRYGSVWALLRRCTCCRAKIVWQNQPHLYSVTDTPCWSFYSRLLAREWTYPSHDKIAGIRQYMRSFGLPFWDQQRMVALGFPTRQQCGAYGYPRDYTANIAALYTEDEFRSLAISSSHHRRDSAEDLAMETWALSHMQDYRCGVWG